VKRSPLPLSLLFPFSASAVFYRHARGREAADVRPASCLRTFLSSFSSPGWPASARSISKVERG